jgi:hypothetical protein
MDKSRLRRDPTNLRIETMARIAKVTKSITKPAATKRKPGRPAAAGPRSAVKATKPAAVQKRAPVAAAPKVSKDELRAQVEKLELSVAALRAKNREANRAAKTAAARIAELEDQVARLEKNAASQAAPAKRGSSSASPGRGARRSKVIDPGDAVPPGVAVEDPAPLDQEAETALENLEEHLGEKAA